LLRPSAAVPANEALINSSPDCQRLALINFFKTRFGEPKDYRSNIRSITRVLVKYDWQLTNQHKFLPPTISIAR
jgi:hypothetical protein